MHYANRLTLEIEFVVRITGSHRLSWSRGYSGRLAAEESFHSHNVFPSRIEQPPQPPLRLNHIQRTRTLDR